MMPPFLFGRGMESCAYELTQQEQRDIFAEGMRRQTMRVNYPHRAKYKPKSVRQHSIMNGWAALAEAITAAWTGREWLSRGSKPDIGTPDVRGGIQVHHCEYTHPPLGKMLKVRKDGDDPQWIYVGVVGREWPLEIIGWQFGYLCMQDRFFKREGDPIPGSSTPVRDDSWWVPQIELNDHEPDRLLERLIAQPGEDQDLLIEKVNDPAWNTRYVGAGAFGIRYD